VQTGSNVEVGSPGDKAEKNTFKVSPEMMERLKSNQGERKKP